MTFRREISRIPQEFGEDCALGTGADPRRTWVVERLMFDCRSLLTLMRLTVPLLVLYCILSGGLSAQDSRPAILERLLMERRDVDERHRIAAEALAAEEDRLAATLAGMKTRKAEADLRLASLQRETQRQAEIRKATESRHAANSTALADLRARLKTAVVALRSRLPLASAAVAESISHELGRVGDMAVPLSRRIAALSSLTERLLLDARSVSAVQHARAGKSGLQLRLGSLGTWWIPESGIALRSDGKAMSAQTSDALRRVARQAARMEPPAVLPVPIEAFK